MRPHDLVRRLAALRPLASHRLPKSLRAENVSALAGGFPLGVRDPGFERLVLKIETSPIYQCADPRLFFSGDEAFAEICRALEGATSEILLETYILRDDATGDRIMELLVAAARRGARVHVLADAYGSWNTRSRFWGKMKDNGVEARLFHPFLGPLRGLFFRDHRKIIVIDRSVAFVGGMNIGNEYGSSHRVRPNAGWRDTHARVEGLVAGELAVIFGEGWSRSGGRRMLVKTDTPKAGADPRALVLDSLSGRGQREIMAVLAAMVAAARKTLWITNSYFAPDRAGLRLLTEAAGRGVDVRLMLQGKTDMPIVRHAGHGSFDELLEAGVRVFEYQSAMLHAKTIVVDEYATVVGSSNLDFRSFYFNAECNLLIFDDKTGASMAQAFVQDMSESLEIRLEEWRRRPALHRCVDAAARFLSPLL